MVFGIIWTLAKGARDIGNKLPGTASLGRMSTGRFEQVFMGLVEQTERMGHDARRIHKQEGDL